MATFADVMEEMAYAESSLLELRNAMIYEEGVLQSTTGGHVPQADIDAFNRARSQLAQNLTRTLSQFQSMLDEASLPASVKARIRSYLGEKDWGLDLLDRVPPLKFRTDGRLGALPALGALTTAQMILAGVIAISAAAVAISIAVVLYEWAQSFGKWAEADTRRTVERAACIRAVQERGGTQEDLRRGIEACGATMPPLKMPDLPGTGGLTTLIVVGIGAYLLFQLAPSIRAVAEGETRRRYHDPEPQGA